MAQITDILHVGGTRDTPFDVMLYTLAALPRPVPYTNHNFREHNELNSAARRNWTQTCKEVKQWRQVCRSWRDCHDQHDATGSKCIHLCEFVQELARRKPKVPGSDDEILILKFECKVVMSPGRTLGPFECDEVTSIGWMRSRIRKVLEKLYNKGELDFVDFHLMRDGSVKCLTNDCTKIHELVNIDDAVLSIKHDTGAIERAPRAKRPRSQSMTGA